MLSFFVIKIYFTNIRHFSKPQKFLRKKVLPANFIERRQSVKEITCDLIQVARAGASRTDRDGIAPNSLTRQLPTTPKGDNLEKRLMGGVGIMGEVGAVGEV